jgi:hypothetical protein
MSWTCILTLAGAAFSAINISSSSTGIGRREPVGPPPASNESSRPVADRRECPLFGSIALPSMADELAVRFVALRDRSVSCT